MYLGKRDFVDHVSHVEPIGKCAILFEHVFTMLSDVWSDVLDQKCIPFGTVWLLCDCLLHFANYHR